MKLKGKCGCGSCQVVIEGLFNPKEIGPRICDCDYCKANPSAIISSPDINCTITCELSNIRVETNGSGQATFYHCGTCNQLLAVGANFSGMLLGAVNAYLCGDINQFGEPVPIQPKLLSAEEKTLRWSKLWGPLTWRYQ